MSTMDQLKELRERTGLPMLECKKALTQSGGDIDAAIEALRKKGQLKAAKKSSRVTAEGVVAIRVTDSATTAYMLEVNCETDFVARDEGFLALVKRGLDLAEQEDLSNVAELAEKLEQAREELVQKIGENITIRRLVRLQDKVVGGYVHGGRKAALVALKGKGSVEMCDDVAMHVVASAPLVTRREEMPASQMEKEKEVYTAQAGLSGKPAQIVEKMVEGRLKKFLSESCLVDQPFVKNPDQTVGQLVEQAGAEVAGFARMEVGEGIEKAESNFAEEVMAQANRS